MITSILQKAKSKQKTLKLNYVRQPATVKANQEVGVHMFPAPRASELGGKGKRNRKGPAHCNT